MSDLIFTHKKVIGNIYLFAYTVISLVILKVIL